MDISRSAACLSLVLVTAFSSSQPAAAGPGTLHRLWGPQEQLLSEATCRTLPSSLARRFGCLVSGTAGHGSASALPSSLVPETVPALAAPATPAMDPDPAAGGEDLNVITVVGGHVGTGGPATRAQLRFPAQVTFDGHGNMFFADTHNFCVWKVDASTGIITAAAGVPQVPGFSGDGGPATETPLGLSAGVAVAGDGTLYVAESAASKVRAVDPVTGIMTTLAGTGAATGSIDGEGGDPADDLGDGGPAAAASLAYPGALALDPLGNLYVAQELRIRRIDAVTGIITTVAGTGTAPGSIDGEGGDPADDLSDGGPATSAALGLPSVNLDPGGNLLIADLAVHRVRRVDALTGIITTIAGTGSTTGSIDGEGGDPADDLGDGGPATAASLDQPYDAAADDGGNLYIADSNNQRVRRIDAVTGTISTLAGTGRYGYSPDPATAASAELAFPSAVTVHAGVVYITDGYSQRIRRVDGTGMIETAAGRLWGEGEEATRGRLNAPFAVEFDEQGDLLIPDRNSYRLMHVDLTGDWTLTTAAGISTVSTIGAFDVGGNRFPGESYTAYLGDGLPATSAWMHNITDAVTDSNGRVFISEWRIDAIRSIDPETGIVTNHAGTRTRGFSGDGGPASLAAFNTPIDVAVNSQDDLLIVDFENLRVRRIEPATGLITTVAGTGIPTGSIDGEGGDPADDLGDGGPAAQATFTLPIAVDVGPEDDLYVADLLGQRIRKIETDTGIITTVAGSGILTGSIDGEGGDPGDDLRDGGPATAATISFPSGVAADPEGNIYVSDQENHRIRRVDAATGVIATIAGTGEPGFSGEGGPATEARTTFPGYVAVDDRGNVIFDDSTDRMRLLASAAEVELRPAVIPATSRGRWVTVFIEPSLPASSLDAGAFRLYRVDQATGDPLGPTLRPDPSAPAAIADHDRDGRLELAVRFDRSSLRGLGHVGETMQLRVVGATLAGRFVSGDAMVPIR